MTDPTTSLFKRDDPVLVRALQAVTFCGLILGVVLYAFLAVRSDIAASHRGLAEAASAGQLAAESELARIDAAIDRTAPLIAGTLGENVPAENLRAARTRIADILASTPISAIAVLDGKGGVISVFGQMPADAAGALTPVSQSQRAGRELLDLDLAQISPHRAAYFSHVQLASGAQVPLVFVLRSGAFRAALEFGVSETNGWRAALLNVDGTVVLSNAVGRAGFSRSDAEVAARATVRQYLYTDETQANEQIRGQEKGAILEIRPVSGGRFQLVYAADEPSLLAAIVSRQWEFMALSGVTLLALVLALSLIQNEWRRDDRESEDVSMVLAQARASCNLLDAGVIDWSVDDGRVTYSDGWAERFSRGSKPVSEEAYDWIARIHPDDQEKARDVYQSMLDGAVSDVEHRIRIRLPSGLWVQILERGRAINKPDGRVGRIVLVQTPEAADGGALRQAFSELTNKTAHALAG